MNILSDNEIDCLVGHNLKQFDLPRLNYLFEIFGNHAFFSSFKIEDTLLISRERLNIPCNKLESVCKHFGIVNNNCHRALGDCYATLELLKKLSQ
jgi:DNA polymerase III epsilon subunit-like protein